MRLMTGAGRWKDDRFKKMGKAKLAQRQGALQFKGELKFSIKKNKRYFNRQVRRYTKDLPNGKAYRKLAGEKVWNYVV